LRSVARPFETLKKRASVRRFQTRSPTYMGFVRMNRMVEAVHAPE
jgi:hypothetical protein